jgi:hypothetical protein
MESIGAQVTWSSFSKLESLNDDIFWSFVWLYKVVCIENKLFHWMCMVTFEFEYNDVEIKSFSANMT